MLGTLEVEIINSAAYGKIMSGDFKLNELTRFATAKQVKGFTMTGCLDCHRKPKDFLPYLSEVKKGPHYCAACHR